MDNERARVDYLNDIKRRAEEEKRMMEMELMRIQAIVLSLDLDLDLFLTLSASSEPCLAPARGSPNKNRACVIAGPWFSSNLRTLSPRPPNRSHRPASGLTGPPDLGTGPSRDGEGSSAPCWVPV